MSTESAIHDSIERAATSVGKVWPLHSFVTANPLSGFENDPFPEAVAEAERLFGGRGYPSAGVFRNAWDQNRIDESILRSKLDEHGFEGDPEALLDRMANSEDVATTASDEATQRLDRIMSKWLSAFLDQGQAEWSMPHREEGFYEAFRTVTRHDSDIPTGDLPVDEVDAIEQALDAHPTGRWADVFEYHLAALPGWTGLIRQRAADGGDWQDQYPVTLKGYLAARLAVAAELDAPMAPSAGDESETTELPLAEVWLQAWEASYRETLVDTVADAGESAAESDESRPDAQMVFCIDTRSEIIRRHVEAAGDYETHGYAGFFGVPMRYSGYDEDVSIDACPPIVDAAHRIEERPTDEAGMADRDHYDGLAHAGTKLLKSIKNNAATAFSFVESAGSGYGAALAARTLLPDRVYDAETAVDDRVPDDHEFCDPALDHDHGGPLPGGLTHEQKVEYAATAFELMGWEQFARLVVFTGHASQTTNNPFDSSLDCGACAANPGGPNARVLAAICNDEAVRASLRERGIDVPDDTVFLGGEHNTTTDEIALFDGHVPESHAADLETLREDLQVARAGAAAERTGEGVRETERRAADWAEARPEWGLAGNAAFVVGPRALTEGVSLDGRSFLHSYDYTTDSEGDALEAIMAGPMVVTQWINCQYYFATVDTAVYGSGSKVTQNPVGNVGVRQGNGGDLMRGLPLQSLMAGDDDPYHQPLRLSTVIHAPVERVTDILADNDALTTLLDNGWLSLTVVDPEQDHRAFHYEGDLGWASMDDVVETFETSTAEVAADD